MIEDLESRSRARIGMVLEDKWTLEQLLGLGGMAAVYAARHRNGARAAIKILHHHLARHGEVRERFLREGYAANRVGHPGAVKVLDDDTIRSGADEGAAYIVMELLEGESLQDRVERGPPLTETEFLRIADQVLDVLAAAHEQGVIHRDLKPENLFLARATDAAPDALRVKVLDFGLARILQGQAITSHGLALGTPSFMSPEQAAGLIHEIDGRTDLFALAATGFRVRTGRRIHEGDSPVDLVRKMGHLPAPPIRAVLPEVSEAYARVIDRGLAFERDDRFASAGEMQLAVRGALAELSMASEPTLLAAPGPLAGAVPGSVPEPRDPPTIALGIPAVALAQAVGMPAVAVAPAAPLQSDSSRAPKDAALPKRALTPWFVLLAGLAAVALLVAGARRGSLPGPPADAGSPEDAPSGVPSLAGSLPDVLEAGTPAVDEASGAEASEEPLADDDDEDDAGFDAATPQMARGQPTRAQPVAAPHAAPSRTPPHTPRKRRHPPLRR